MSVYTEDGAIKTPRRHRFEKGVYQKAQELLNDPAFPTYKAIADELNGLYQGDAPSERTLAEWEDKGWIARDDRFAPWSMWSASADDVELVLPVVRFLIEQTHRLEARPSNVIAEWIVKIRRVRPDLPIGTVLEAAFLAQADKGNVPTVEAYLAGAIPTLHIGVRVSLEDANNG